MASMSYLSVIERYHEYEALVHELLESILTGMAGVELFVDTGKAIKIFSDVAARYPFVELMYLLDSNGRQISPNLALINQQVKLLSVGESPDRSQRPYYLNVRDKTGVQITRPYLSNASGHLCLSASIAQTLADNKKGFVVVDINLTCLIEYMMGDRARRRVTPIFKAVYATLVTGLFIIVGVLICISARDIWQLLIADYQMEHDSLRPFGTIIFITLALAIFDLGKTILEEEVLMHKDIFRHSSTRRTITRFVSTILIAISIEALLTMFKASLGKFEYIQGAIFMMLAVVGLLVGLGLYVYLGAKAEALLTQQQGNKQKQG
ncbi:general glycosylation pathway protein [Shewanella mangrovi]|uniref:General glycosylation pathway protein n=1 Tax=Shewanella mangrovi TaxID=1515746 RepID=A0A094LNW0_9GAMM|nr:PDC sensor domain-containing protein [Shewanella mangrovi]KFZ36808.1 general glycosylation pathway protein [Shewanella mangrovi]